MNWHNWETTDSLWRNAAILHRQRPPRVVDDVLRNLLKEHATADALNKRVLNKKIWRRRRWIKRCRAKASICNAAELGRFPVSRQKNLLVNWTKLCGSKDPSTVLTEFYTDIYHVDPQTLQTEVRRKEDRLSIWHSLRIDVIPFQVTMERLLAAFQKLKPGKSSPDGCTAEMFRALPTQFGLS